MAIDVGTDEITSTRVAWPEEIRLRVDARSVHLGRTWAAHEARAAGAGPDVVDLTELLASELVTNAVKYGSPDGVLTLGARRRGTVLEISVTDDGPGAPHVCHPGDDEVGGRGLAMVEQLAVRWGVRMHVPGDGKSVWFELSLPDAAA